MPITLNNLETQIRINRVNNENLIDYFPPMIYSIGQDDDGLYLAKRRQQFNEPEKIYGRNNRDKSAIIHEFDRRKGQSSGVLLTGEKGSGKTLLAESVANHYVNKGYPVLIVDESRPAGMIKMVVQIMDPCVVIFDEFSKNFPIQSNTAPDQQDLLSLFSDSSLKHTLFLVVDNDIGEVSTYLIHRPGRMMFAMNYDYIDKATVRELLDDYGIKGQLRHHLEIYADQTTFDITQMVTEIAAQYNDGTVESYEAFLSYMDMINVPSLGFMGLTLLRMWDNDSNTITPSASMNADDSNDKLHYFVFTDNNKDLWVTVFDKRGDIHQLKRVTKEELEQVSENCYMLYTDKSVMELTYTIMPRDIGVTTNPTEFATTYVNSAVKRYNKHVEAKNTDNSGVDQPPWEQSMFTQPCFPGSREQDPNFPTGGFFKRAYL